MKADKYPVIALEGSTRFEFLSEGPNGTIRKVVRYQRISVFLYNLAFGDWDEETQALLDFTRSNNSDRDKVLATVASTVIEFLQFHPGATVFARGSTPSRTRLYHIGIKANLPEVGKLFTVEGYFEGNWEIFHNSKFMRLFLSLRNKKLNLILLKTTTMSTPEINGKTVPAVTYVKKMRNYDKDPFFVKKKQDAIEFIKKNSVPNSVKEKMKAANQNLKQKSRTV